MRYLTPFLKRDLQKKMVLLAGPRQCGKTTLGKSLVDVNGVYLNWDILKNRRIIREQSWPKDASILVLDELHKERKWKNFLKGIIDEYQNKPPLLVTGSARLDAFRKSGDALTGRNYFYRLHPIDPAEAMVFLPKASSEQRVKLLMQTGGFPEAFLNPKEADRLRADRLDLVLRGDLQDISKISTWQGLADLIELLRERVGKSVSFDGLAQDLRVSPPTVKNWITALENLYLIFLLPSYSSQISRSIRKEKRVYFYDCASAYDITLGAQLENLVASALLKFTQFRTDSTGERWQLHYLRDKEKREVDFVVTKNRKVEWLIEVKSSETNISKNLYYFKEKLQPTQAIQLVLHLDKPLEKNGVAILPATKWLEKLAYT